VPESTNESGHSTAMEPVWGDPILNSQHSAFNHHVFKHLNKHCLKILDMCNLQ